MACGTNIDAQVFLGRPGFKCIATCTGDSGLFVLGMNGRFQQTSPLFHPVRIQTLDHYSMLQLLLQADKKRSFYNRKKLEISACRLWENI
jgi:hypothetical protein